MGRDLFVAVDPCLSSLRALALSYYTEQKSLFSHQMRAHDLDLGHRRQHPVQMLSYHPRPIGSPQKQSPREPFCLLQEFWAIVLNFPVQITGDFFNLVGDYRLLHLEGGCALRSQKRLTSYSINLQTVNRLHLKLLNLLLRKTIGS